MADSDDEYDRKRRDKFRGERAEATYRGTERIGRPRDDWVERDAWSRPRPREYRPGIRDRGYSPTMEPMPKRVRHDYYGDSYYNHYMPYHQMSHRSGNFSRESSSSSTQIEGQQPPMMSFKAFLATQDDNISDSEAIEKYNDYKLEFQRQQLNEFFVAHKDDEWFRLKYHPEESSKRRTEQMAALKKRLEVFMDVKNTGKLDVQIDCVNTSALLKLLDMVVIKLEDGTDEDLLTLDDEYIENTETEEKTRDFGLKAETNEDYADKNEMWDVEMVEDKPAPNTSNKVTNDEECWDPVDESESKKAENEEGEQEEDTKEEGEKNEESKLEDSNGIAEESTKTPDNEPQKDEETENETKEIRNGSPNNSETEDEGDKSNDKSTEEHTNNESEKPENEVEETVENDEKSKEDEESETKIDDDKTEGNTKNDKPVIKPKWLHKTTSIFLRNLSPTITKQEVEAVCSRYDGFLRVALADPQPERRWLRRGWVTFKRDANIKEICWNLNNIRLRDCELGAIVNRDLSRRIRPVNGITAHKQVVRSDIRIAAKVVLHLDQKAGLWQDSNNGDDEKKNSNDKQQSKQNFGFVSNNPILHNITDYLIEEASAEEEELLGLEPTTEQSDTACTVERDDELISVLDRIILYLRVVHSVDYYNHCEYPNEDEMPNRCGILHARGPAPTAKTDITQFVGVAVENKMSNFLPEKPRDENKNEAKLIHLSLKDVDTEIDKFVQANTRELAKDKWLCPLSGKKFKGPDFVRKHIFNKHAEKIEEVKKEVEFFNNYLRDPKRPMLAEAPQPKREDNYNNSGFGGGGGGGGGGPGMNRMMPYYGQGFSQRSRGYPSRPRAPPTDYRPVIHYRDLDAPREPEEFI